MTIQNMLPWFSETAERWETLHKQVDVLFPGLVGASSGQIKEKNPQAAGRQQPDVQNLQVGFFVCLF